MHPGLPDGTRLSELPEHVQSKLLASLVASVLEDGRSGYRMATPWDDLVANTVQSLRNSFWHNAIAERLADIPQPETIAELVSSWSRVEGPHAPSEAPLIAV